MFSAFFLYVHVFSRRNLERVAEWEWFPVTLIFPYNFKSLVKSIPLIISSPPSRCITSVEMLTWFGCLTGWVQDVIDVKFFYTIYFEILFFRFSHLFLIFNASVNFLIYCSLNNDFKTELKNVLNKLFSHMV